MTRYQLAKLISWAGSLRARKRLQKVVYLLQAEGCPLTADYSLHHYGPYSEDVSRLTDEMVRQALLAETVHDHSVGRQYTYHVPAAVQKELQELEATDRGRQWAAELAPFEARAKGLLSQDLTSLEHAATIVYFRRQGCEWDAAVDKAVAFKRTEAVKAALPLAKSVLA